MSGSVTGRAEDRFLVSWAMPHRSYNDSCRFDGSVAQDTFSALGRHRLGGWLSEQVQCLARQRGMEDQEAYRKL